MLRIKTFFGEKPFPTLALRCSLPFLLGGKQHLDYPLRPPENFPASLPVNSIVSICERITPQILTRDVYNENPLVRHPELISESLCVQMLKQARNNELQIQHDKHSVSLTKRFLFQATKKYRALDMIQRFLHLH